MRAEVFHIAHRNHSKRAALRSGHEPASDTPLVGMLVTRLWSACTRATLLLAALAAGAASADTVSAQEPPDELLSDDRSPHSEITAGAEFRTVRAGQRITVALRVTLDPGWHTYWTNGGDAGLPMNAVWSLPDGIRVGALQFPTPSLMPEGPLMTYGYVGEVTYLADVTLPASLRAGEIVRLNAAADWLACAELCLPAAGDVSLSLRVIDGAAQHDTEWAPRIDAARAKLPLDASLWQTRGWTTSDGYVLALIVPEDAQRALMVPYFFPDSMSIVDHAQPQRVAWIGDTLLVSIARSPFADADAAQLSGLLAANVSGLAGVGRTGYRILASVDTTAAGSNSALASTARELLAAPSAQITGGVNNVLLQTSAAVAPESSQLGLAAALLFALVGGLILNLMPCVFPVLSVKVLGFLEHGGGDSRVGRRHGLVFATGVLATFWLLAGSLLLLRAGGESLGWGFQMQSPPVVALLALVMFALALNLSGVFEIGMSLTRLGGAGSGRSYTDSFATGALAVIVATPCTAPFMGAALGFALVQPPLASMLVFTALAVGLALPYVVFAAVPSLLRFLPRPGPWLETFKQALAFPLYATVVWLLWVFGQQKNMNALAVLMLGLTLFALGAWLWGRAAVRQRVTGRVIGALAMAGAVAVAVRGGSAPRVEADAVDAPPIVWETYSPARLAELRTEGRPVLLDFTAAWCLSCQVNERVALQSSAARRAFAELNVALVQADWTSRDADIAAVIASYGRSGIPLYVLYGSDPALPPELLPAVLTPGMVVDAVRRAAGAGAAGAD